MHCIHCNKKLSIDPKLCPSCGKSVETKEEQNNHEKNTEVDLSHKEIHRWSWGAFGLSWLYFLGMRSWLALIFILSNLLQSFFSALGDNVSLTISVIIWLVTVVIGGIVGRRVAAKSRKWKSANQFILSQKAWDGWGIALSVLYVLYIVSSFSR